eukprot:191443-Chlamydomonas_euryale.AAC.13
MSATALPRSRVSGGAFALLLTVSLACLCVAPVTAVDLRAADPKQSDPQRQHNSAQTSWQPTVFRQVRVLLLSKADGRGVDGDFATGPLKLPSLPSLYYPAQSRVSEHFNFSAWSLLPDAWTASLPDKSTHACTAAVGSSLASTSMDVPLHQDMPSPERTCRGFAICYAAVQRRLLQLRLPILLRGDRQRLHTSCRHCGSGLPH